LSDLCVGRSLGDELPRCWALETGEWPVRYSQLNDEADEDLPPRVPGHLFACAVTLLFVLRSFDLLGDDESSC
jgi:hypothetical protein